jgi:hypothetical protein
MAYGKFGLGEISAKESGIRGKKASSVEATRKNIGAFLPQMYADFSKLQKFCEFCPVRESDRGAKFPLGFFFQKKTTSC